jgi:hypothetical protein
MQAPLLVKEGSGVVNCEFRVWNLELLISVFPSLFGRGTPATGRQGEVNAREAFSLSINIKDGGGGIFALCFAPGKRRKMCRVLMFMIIKLRPVEGIVNVIDFVLDVKVDVKFVSHLLFSSCNIRFQWHFNVMPYE